MLESIVESFLLGPILLYDGVCGLCNRLVQFVLHRDPAGVFRVASLQSDIATRILARHGVDERDLDTIYVVLEYDTTDERLLARSDAVVFILRHLRAADLSSAHRALRPGPTQISASTQGSLFWRVTGMLLQTIPRVLREWGYRVVARNRYRIFGRYDTCPLPSESTRERFLG
jgi:predicted DCC family thiol-disulfide oxidoreductase YuxK